MKKAIYVTTRKRALVAMLGGALTGSVLFPVGFLLCGDVDLDWNADPLEVVVGQASLLFACLTLIAALGLPAWFVLSRNTRRGPLLAILVGAAITSLVFLGGLAWIVRGELYLVGVDEVGLAVAFAASALCGGGVGLATWRIAYRRQVDKTPEAFA
ncbi:MAG: hypothetical protein ABUS57_18525 [Pseudomonadota bacterium]